MTGVLLACGVLVVWGGIVVERRRRIRQAPDLCERYRRVWAVSNDEIRGIGA